MKRQANPALTFDNTEIAFAGKSNLQLRKAYYLFKLMNNNFLVNTGSILAEQALKWHLPIGFLLKKTIYEHFCGGETLPKTQTTINELGKYNVRSLLDYGVEGKSTNAAFDRTTAEALRAISYAQKEVNVEAMTVKISALAKFTLLEKINRKQTLNGSDKRALAKVKKRLHSICEAAQEAGNVTIYFDAEESWIQDALDGLIMELMETYNCEKVVLFNTIQLYRHDRLAFLKKAHQTAKDKGYILAVKLVRGAYMEKENKRAKVKKYPSPIQPNKAATDNDFDAAIVYCLDHLEEISFCNASHNEKSALILFQLMQERGIPNDHPHIYFAQLYGMSDHISFNLSQKSCNVAKYLPYGPVKEVIPYLIRRAKENTSVAGQMGRELNLILQELKRRNIR